MNSYKYITNKTKADKLNFIRENSICGIPSSFNPLRGSCPEKIFFRINAHGQNKSREWILFNNNLFYCSHCLCFSTKKQGPLIDGVEYKKNCRISEILKNHEAGAHHIHATNIFISYRGGAPATSCDIPANEKRGVLCSIVKIIIFLATHG